MTQVCLVVREGRPIGVTDGKVTVDCQDQQQAKQIIKDKFGHDLDQMTINTNGYEYPILGLSFTVKKRWRQDEVNEYVPYLVEVAILSLEQSPEDPIRDLAEAIGDKGFKVTFGIQPEHIRLIEEKASKWGGVQSIHFWQEIGKAIGWDAFTICAYYADYLKENPSPEVSAAVPKGEGGEDKERILCAANWYDDGKEHPHQPKNIRRGFVVCGRRHHNIINTLSSAFDWQDSKYVNIQGFITDKDRFVTRKEAYDIAFKADQIKGPNKGQSKNSIGLTSEDLY